MSVDLYLVVLDAAGKQIRGGSAADKVRDPFRDLVVSQPFAVRSSAFGGSAPTSPGGTRTGRFDVTELVVTMTDDTAGALLFLNAVQNRIVRAMDVRVVTRGERAVTVGGVGVDDAVLTGISWAVDTDGPVRTLRIEGRRFSVGSADQRPNGTLAPFAISTFEPATA